MGDLHVLVLLINKIGHRHQAEGVAHVVERMVPATRASLEVAPRRWAFPALRNLSVALSRWIGIRAALWLIYGIDPARLRRPDVVIGSGRPAVPVGILLGRWFGVPHVYSGLADGMRLAPEIDLRLVSVQTFGDEPNAVFTPVPCLVEPDRLPVPRPLKRIEDLAGAKVALLLGGDAHSHDFDLDDWLGIARLVRGMRDVHGVSWIVTDSRRTAAAASEVFRGLAEEGVIERFVDCRRPETGRIADLFAADAIVVTEDSVSMMSEAVAAQRPVVALRPRRTRETLVDDVVGTLRDGGAMEVLAIATASVDDLAATLVRLEPNPEDHRDRIAAALVERLPQLFRGRKRR